ncbi:hypothetical protein KBD49_12040 [Myxococcota bacterium]|nr:hypothetical protein [Myxococcota bacterium]
MRHRAHQAAYALLAALCAATILWTWATGGRETPGFLPSGRQFRSVDPAEIERRIQQQRLSDREAMFYRPFP